VPACRSIDTISVFARSVDETLAVMRVIAAPDSTDPYSRKSPAPHLRKAAEPPKLRVVMAEVGDLCTSETTRLYKEAAARCDATPVDIGIFLEIARLLYDGPWVAERTSALRAVVGRQPDILHPVTRKVLESGFGRNTVDAFDAFHRLAQARQEAARLFAEYDVLLVPTAPLCPSLTDLEAEPIAVNSRLGTFTNFVNLCDLAAIAVPAGIGADGLPVGVTLIGPAWSEGRLAALADRLHRAVAPVATMAPDALAPDETALFCLGAHMSGLPLNRQITERGGRFLRESRTLPRYRLFALGPRPGLLRVAEGAAIAGEVWALPQAAVGGLLAEVSAPLGFGTVALEEGDCLGFLAEAAGVEGAPDITLHGGWRAWLANRPQP
jgi:allophanate hydrolase